MQVSHQSVHAIHQVHILIDIVSADSIYQHLTSHPPPHHLHHPPPHHTAMYDTKFVVISLSDTIHIVPSQQKKWT